MILIKSSLKYIRKHYIQSLLAILGIAIGISITIAIDLAIKSSQKSFEIATSRITGEASHQILASKGIHINEDIYRKLKTELALRNISPIIEDFVVVNKDKGYHDSSISQKQSEKIILKLLGVDPFAELKLRKGLDFSPVTLTKGFNNNDVLVSEKTAKELNLKIGDKLEIRIGSLLKEVEIAAYIKDSSNNYNNLLLTDISTAQNLLGLNHKLSYINLKSTLNSKFKSAYRDISEDELSKFIGEDYSLQNSKTRTQSVNQMTKSFNLNLTALSFLSLVVAIFLIYNSMSFSIVQRRKILAVLKAIGTSKKQILAMVFIEAIIFALIGTSLGIFLGIFLGKVLMGLVTQTINDLYFTLEINKFNIDIYSLIKASLLGLIASLIAAIFPAIDASRSSPLIAMSRSNFEQKSSINFNKLFFFGLVLIGLASLILKFSTGIILGFTGLFFILLGLAFLTPVIVKSCCQVLSPIYHRLFGFIGSLALKSISSQLSRTSIAIATLMIAISMSIGLNITIKSFRNTVETWLNNSLKADIYISAPRLISNKVDKNLEPDFIKNLLTQFSKDIKEVLTYRNLEVNSNLGSINLASIKSTDTVRSLFKFKKSSPKSWKEFAAYKDVVLISEAFAYKHKLKINDQITLETPRGNKRLKVAAIFTDFGSEKGIVMIADKVFQNYFQDKEISSLGLILKDTENKKKAVDNLIERIQERFSNNYVLFIRSNFSLKEESLTVFDRTFKVTNVLKWISILVAFIAVLSAFMSLQLEKIREFSILKANGVSPGQISWLLLLQTLTMGLFASVLALPAGLVQAFVMIFIINKRSFGWSLEYSFENSFIVEAIFYSLIASTLAVIYPIYYTNKMKISEGIRYE